MRRRLIFLLALVGCLTLLVVGVLWLVPGPVLRLKVNYEAFTSYAAEFDGNASIDHSGVGVYLAPEHVLRRHGVSGVCCPHGCVVLQFDPYAESLGEWWRGNRDSVHSFLVYSASGRHDEWLNRLDVQRVLRVMVIDATWIFVEVKSSDPVPAGLLMHLGKEHRFRAGSIVR